MFRNLSPVVKNLILINILFFVGTLAWQPQVEFNEYPDIASFTDLGRYSLTAFPPHSKYFYPVQVVSNIFMHGDFFHLLFNMFGLFFFGSMVEQAMGPKRFFTFYIAAGLGGLLLFWVAGYFLGSLYVNVPVLGASGAVYGVLLSLAYLDPNMRIQLLLPPIPLKIGYLAVGLVAFDLIRGWSGAGGGTAYFAHVGGALVGLLLTMFWSSRKGGLYKG